MISQIRRAARSWIGPLLALQALLTIAPASAAAQTTRAELDAARLTHPLDLDGTWLVQAGDDLAWAEPDFDDSKWIPFDPHTSIKALFPASRPEVIWYRARVKIDAKQAGLGLRELNISRAFEVYVNRRRLIASGQVAPYAPATMGARRLARIPDGLTASGILVVAIRVHLSPLEWANGQDPGYYATNLTLGDYETLDRLDWLSVIGQNLLHWADLFLLVAVGAVALILFAGQRRQYEYLWIAALAFINLAQSPFQLATLFHDLPVRWQLLNGLLLIASPICWVSLYFTFVHQRTGWRLRVFLLLAGLLNAWDNLDGLLPSLPGAYAVLTNLPFVVMLSVVIHVMLAIHVRRGNREAGILLIPVILFSLYIYVKFALALLFNFPGSRALALRGFDIIDGYRAGPIVLGLNHISGILSTISLAIIMLLRSSRMSRSQALLESELAAAQQVQQMLVPEEIESIPGFLVETAYQPAQQVGGDFFQILPVAGDGVLLVVGDVAGKGLPAAMMVSLLVGAIRTAAENTSNPSALLTRLNERLVGRSCAGFSTALAAHLTADGVATIANAGHLSPYLDGRELELRGALPLGIISGVIYEATQLQLNPGSRLTFYSDGVIEAQRPDGELFGFDRGQSISTQPALAIAEAAKLFGQSDDITVVTISRVATAGAIHGRNPFPESPQPVVP